MRPIDADGSFTINATDNTSYSLAFGGGIISCADEFGHIVADFSADDIPTIDAVPVVRCRKCKNWLPGGYKSIADPQNPQCGGRCWYSNVARFENDFCSYGERKEGTGGEST